MGIDETLKENLISDVKNILDIELTDNDETALMRCFEITIGHHFKLPPSEEKKEISDDMQTKIISGLITAFKSGHISIHSTYEKVADYVLEELEIKPTVEGENNNALTLFNAYTEFVWKAFPDASCNDHLKKLKIEADEAMQDNRDITEFADCLGAIYGAVSKAGFLYPELIKAGFEKLEINKVRKWEKLPDGTYQHI